MGFSENSILTFLNRANELKRLPRTGWLLAGVRNPESVAEHTCSTALLAMMLAEIINREPQAEGLNEELDIGRVMTTALIHDLSESVVTDLPRGAAEALGRDVKHLAERKASRSIFANLASGGKYELLWDEYATGSSPEAKAVRDADKLEMVHQALHYERSGHQTLAEFWGGHSWHYAASEALFDALTIARNE